MKYLSAFLLILTLSAFMTFAMPSGNNDVVEQDVLEMSIDQNIATPAVPVKAKKYIKATIDQLRRHFDKNGLKAELLRDDEVIQIVIPCSKLFGPCATDLRPSAGELLKHFSVVLREPLKYKLLVAVHSDDTGDNVYADSITASRANAIDDYFWQLVGEKETNVIPYGIGKDEPLLSNSSRANREVNRRVEFFIVPDNELLRMAGVKK